MNGGAIGFIGLGNMGRPMSANLRAASHDLVVYDKAGTAERAPAGAAVAGSVDEVARQADVVFLSLPDGPAVTEVTSQIVAAGPRATKTVVDLSTIGIRAAESAGSMLGAAGLAYLDAPVSGGVAGASKGTLAMMVAGEAALFERLLPVLEVMAGNCFHVGSRAGQGQAMKLLNNFLSGTAMIATSEAVSFGAARGLDLASMIAVLNVSTGRNTATSDKFPNRILTGTYDAGFTAGLIAKDLRLYRESVEDAGTPFVVGAAVEGTLRRMAATMSESDFTQVYKFVRGGAQDG